VRLAFLRYYCTAMCYINGCIHDMHVQAATALIFFDVESDETLIFGVKRVQVVLSEDRVNDGCDSFEVLASLVCPGVKVKVSGNPYRTKSGELSLLARDLQILKVCFAFLDTPYRLRYFIHLVCGSLSGEARPVIHRSTSALFH
jgi:lysyl-tRNA synthetase class II